jgi:UDP-glucose 4-epimerase
MVDLLLSRGFDVRVVDNLVGGHHSNLSHHQGNPSLQCYWEDIRRLAPSSPIFDDADYVFHFAGIGDIVPSIEAPAEYMDVNVQGTVRVLECARHARTHKFVYAASSSCYGLAAVPTREDHPINPQYPYALSKFLGEQAAFHWRRVYGVPVNSICIFNAYGTRVRTTGAYGAVFGVFLKQKLAGKPFTVVGDGSQSRDFVYASDVAAAFLAAAETNLAGERFNVGAGNPQTVNRLVQLIGGDVVHVPRRPGEPDCTFADIGKIHRMLGWRPRVGFEEGVGRMMAEIDHWRDAPLWDQESIARATRSWFQYLDNDRLEARNSI